LKKGAVATISFDIPVIPVITGEIVVMGFKCVLKVDTSLFAITLLLFTNTTRISMILLVLLKYENPVVSRSRMQYTTHDSKSISAGGAVEVFIGQQVIATESPLFEYFKSQLHES
jgi:hypothetical protein